MGDPVRLALFGAGGIGVRHLGLAGEEPECEIGRGGGPAGRGGGGRRGPRRALLS